MEREALKLAVDGLEKILHTFAKDGKVVMASMIRNELFAEVNSLLQQAKASLAQPAQEPVEEWFGQSNIESLYNACQHRGYCKQLKAQPPLPAQPAQESVAWVGLTDEEIEAIYLQHHNQYCECESPNWGYERAIEAKLKEKNNG
jgi:hypothetical protein